MWSGEPGPGWSGFAGYGAAGSITGDAAGSAFPAVMGDASMVFNPQRYYAEGADVSGGNPAHPNQITHAGGLLAAYFPFILIAIGLFILEKQRLSLSLAGRASA